MKKQTIEEFMANGGKITRCKTGSKSKTSTTREFMKRDSRLIALKALRANVEGNPQAEQRVDRAIQQRYELLKTL